MVRSLWVVMQESPQFQGPEHQTGFGGPILVLVFRIEFCMTFPNEMEQMSMWNINELSLHGFWSGLFDHFQSLSALIYRTFQNTNNSKVGAKAGNIPLLALHNSKYILQTSIQKSKKKHHPCLEPVDTHQAKTATVLEDGPTKIPWTASHGLSAVSRKDWAFGGSRSRSALAALQHEKSWCNMWPAASNDLDKWHYFFWPFQQPKLQS